MSDRYENRTKGLVAYRLNSDTLTALARDYITLVYGKCDPTDHVEVEPLVLVATNKSGSWGTHKLGTVCTEGVGWLEDETTGLVPVWVDLSPFGGQALRMGLHPRVIVQHITDEQVDLADFVRVFGDRLETNLSIWQSEIRGVDQTEALNAYKDKTNA